ncbi:MAG: hypothetical protein GX207_10010 [Peptococcaceae bacterium]|nr:hypothetical protein [Peptococcaceae bacterium]
MPKIGTELLNQQGYVSLLILLVITFLVGLGNISYHKARAQEKMAVYEAHKVQAIYLADSGLEWAKANLTADPDWGGGSRDLGEGKIEVTVYKDTSGYQVISKSRFKETGQSRSGYLILNDTGQLIISHYEELYN